MNPGEGVQRGLRQEDGDAVVGAELVVGRPGRDQQRGAQGRDGLDLDPGRGAGRRRHGRRRRRPGLQRRVRQRHRPRRSLPRGRFA